MCNVDLTQYVIVNDDGYPDVRHFPPGSDSESGEYVCLLEPGDTLETILTRVRSHWEK